MANKLVDALNIIKALGLPEAQQNDITGYSLLALVNITSKKPWSKVESPLMGVTPIMEWIAANYGKRYKPNTRETFRKNALHRFVDSGIAIQNPDLPSRPVNSPNWVYQIAPSVLELLRMYGTRDWGFALEKHLANNTTLVARYAREREILRLPVKIKGDVILSLTPGAHSELIRAIVVDFGSRFVPEGELVYAGDTGSKWGFFNRELLRTLGVNVGEHGIMPDVVIYCRKRNWLILAEAVTSSGPVDGKRHEDLRELFKESTAGLVFVTAFPDKAMMRKFINDIAWETEVWRADAPTHLIHFNGERFLGPY